MDISDDEDAVQKKALLLHYMGGQCYDIYDTLSADDDDDFAEVKKKLDDYFIPKTNVEYEKYVFHNTKQKDDETLDQFCTRLRKLAVNCDFPTGTSEGEVKSQVIQGCTSVLSYDERL